MKKIFTLFAFALIGFTANAQINFNEVSLIKNDPNTLSALGSKSTSTFTFYSGPVKILIEYNADKSVCLHKVQWIDQIGNNEELSREVKFRKALISEYKKDGYVFDKMERTPKGLFMRFIKNT